MLVDNLGTRGLFAFESIVAFAGLLPAVWLTRLLRR
jgi:hypothetical protein